MSIESPGVGLKQTATSSQTDFQFAALREAHLPMLCEWLARPHAAAWWQPTPSVEQLREDYVAVEHQPNATQAFVAHRNGVPVGFIQCYVVLGSGGGWWEQETDPGARGIDQFLAEEAHLGQGIGRAMIRAFLERTFADSDVTVVQTDPDPRNERAIRCYAAVGFEAIGPVITPDGEALLMRCTRQSLARA